MVDAPPAICDEPSQSAEAIEKLDFYSVQVNLSSPGEESILEPVTSEGIQYIL